MSCGQRVQIHRHHDGELSEGDRAAVEMHLIECAECRELLKDLRSLSVMISSAQRATMPLEAMMRLKDTVRRARERSVMRVAGWLTAAAAAVLVFAMVHGGSAERNDMAVTQPGWELVAATPPSDSGDDSSDEISVMAQWMADELAPGRQR